MAVFKPYTVIMRICNAAGAGTMTAMFQSNPSSPGVAGAGVEGAGVAGAGVVGGGVEGAAVVKRNQFSPPDYSGNV